MNDYPTCSIDVSVDTSPHHTQIPESNPSYYDFAANIPSERNKDPFVVRSSPLLHPFQYPQVLSAEYTVENNDFETFASQTHQDTIEVNPELYTVSCEPIDSKDLNANSIMPFKIVRDEMNGEEQYFCINQSTREKMGPVDVSGVLNYLLGPSINYQFGLHR